MENKIDGGEQMLISVESKNFVCLACNKVIRVRSRGNSSVTCDLESRKQAQNMYKLNCKSTTVESTLDTSLVNLEEINERSCVCREDSVTDDLCIQTIFNNLPQNLRVYSAFIKTDGENFICNLCTCKLPLPANMVMADKLLEAHLLEPNHENQYKLFKKEMENNPCDMFHPALDGTMVQIQLPVNGSDGGGCNENTSETKNSFEGFSSSNDPNVIDESGSSEILIMQTSDLQAHDSEDNDKYTTEQHFLKDSCGNCAELDTSIEPMESVDMTSKSDEAVQLRDAENVAELVPLHKQDLCNKDFLTEVFDCLPESNQKYKRYISLKFDILFCSLCKCYLVTVKSEILESAVSLNLHLSSKQHNKNYSKQEEVD